MYDARKITGDPKTFQAESEGRTIPKEAQQTKQPQDPASVSTGPAPAAVLDADIDHGVALDVDAVLPSKGLDDKEPDDAADLYNQLIDVLQTLGVDRAHGPNVVSRLMPSNPVTFMEVGGQGRMVD